MSTPIALPAWGGNDMQVTVPNFLMDAWDRSESFAIAFCDTYEAVTLAYDKAAEEGRLPTTHDVVVDSEVPTSALHSALLRGEGWFGASELARRYDCCRQTVTRVAGEMGVSLSPRKGTARDLAEGFFRDGETRPSVILAALAQQLPPANLPKRNTITQWRLRWEGNSAR